MVKSLYTNGVIYNNVQTLIPKNMKFYLDDSITIIDLLTIDIN